MPKHAERFKTLPEYPLAKIPQRKRELLERGLDVIDLGAGDADLAPPGPVFKALNDAVNNPLMSRYGFGLGLIAFRDAIAAWMDKRFGFRPDPLTEIVPLSDRSDGRARCHDSKNSRAA